MFGNIFEGFARWLYDSTMSFVDFLEMIIYNPPRLHRGDWTMGLFSFSFSLATYLAVTMTIIAILLAVYSRKGMMRAAHALFVALLMAPLSTVFFAFTDGMVQFGDTLAGGIFGLAERLGSNREIVVSDPSTGLLLIAMVCVAILGFLLVVVFIGYELLIVLITFSILLVLVFTPFGERFQRALEWLISAAIVAMILGRPSALLCIEIAKLASRATAPEIIGVVTTVALIGAFALALWLQWVLIRKTHNVVGRVGGNMVSRVRGSVDAITRPRSSSMIQQINTINSRTMGGGKYRPSLSPGEAASLAVRQVRHDRRATWVATKLASNSHPAAATVTRVASRYFQNREPRRPRV